MKDVIAPLIVGVLFGFGVGWAHLYDPGVIYEMLRFRHVYVYGVVLSAAATAYVGIAVVRSRGSAMPPQVAPKPARFALPGREQWVGAALFGVGWGLACAFPASIAILAARGEIAGVVMGAGILIGVARRDALAARVPQTADEGDVTATEKS
jgi:hypothetical protein